MSKKYRSKTEPNDEIILWSTSGPGQFPVVFSQHRAGYDWWTCSTWPLDVKACAIEEVPEEPIWVGYQWNKEGRLYKVVYKSTEVPSTPYIVVTEGGGSAKIEAEADNKFGYLWWSEKAIRQASAK